MAQLCKRGPSGAWGGWHTERMCVGPQVGQAQPAGKVSNHSNTSAELDPWDSDNSQELMQPLCLPGWRAAEDRDPQSRGRA